MTSRLLGPTVLAKARLTVQIPRDLKPISAKIVYHSCQAAPPGVACSPQSLPQNRTDCPVANTGSALFYKANNLAYLARAVDELLEEGTAKPEGIKVLTQVERLSAIETVRIKSQSVRHMLTYSKKEVSNLKGSIADGFNRIEAWIKTIVTFGGGLVLLGLGTLVYKVMVYDVATNEEVKTRVGHVVAASEAKLDNSIELTTQQQISEVKEIRSMIRDEVHEG